MERLKCQIQPYAWGSHEAIAALRGDAPAEQPEAELWVGAHPLAPSRVLRGGRWLGLDDVIQADPIAELGTAVTAEFGPRLPFLAKILAAHQPLSLQTHPDSTTARAGFERENGNGLPLGARNRTYKDASAKPEILVALSQFEGVCGFRPVQTTLAFLTELDVPLLSDALEGLRSTPDALGLRAMVAGLLSLRETARHALATQILAAVDDYHGAQSDLVAWLPRLHHLYPNDIGLAIVLLLNYVSLRPGEALFLKAGSLHAYLHGLGVEVMANSDNVLRAGFTQKYLDVPELLAITDFTPLPDPIFRPSSTATTPSAIVRVFQPPVAEFAVTRIDLDGVYDVHDAGPSVLLCTAGDVNGLRPTDAAFMRPGHGHLEGRGTVWWVTVGHQIE